ncbi:TlpA family protein disulfide reductase [Marinagarivorans algicola]|uniref:TlpA family protein disulfide reductase n=1 Tax=Marinagarivorans algicola TaxID=1513270 RepID=UPI00373540AE
MKKYYSVAVLVLSAYTMATHAATACADEKAVVAAPDRENAVITGSLQAIPYKNIDGTVQQLNFSQPGVPTLAIFWASWCRTCLAEIPHIKKLQQRFPELNIVGVNVNKNPEKGLSIQQKYTLSYASISDPDLVLADRFNVRGTPGFVLLGANGELKVKTHRLSKGLQATIAQTIAAHGEG